MTLVIIIITALISIAAFNNSELFNKMKFNAWLIREKKQSWRFVTYGFVHAGWFHLLINMFVLFSFGRLVEGVFQNSFGLGKGLFYYALLYFGGIIFATVLDYGRQKNNPYYDAVGASGAVAAVVFSSIILAPTNSLFIFPIPFPIPAYIFGVLYLIYSAYMGKQNKDNIGHNAHFLGAVFGLLFTIAINPQFFYYFVHQLFR